jgi:hypothetical protein
MGEIDIGGRSVTLDRPLKETRVRLLQGKRARRNTTLNPDHEA